MVFGENARLVLIGLFLAIITFFVLTNGEFLDANQNQEQYPQQNQQQYKEQYLDENGNQFLYGGADAYYFFRLARNLDQYGMLGNTIEGDGYGNNVSKDSLRFFPSKDIPPKTIFPHALFYFFKMWKIFNPSILLIQTTAYFPVVLGILSVIIIFFIAREINGDFGGIFTAIIFAIHPLFLYNNYRGYADTHVFAQTWLLLTILCLFFLLEYKNKKTAIFAASMMMFLLFYAKLAWSGLAIIQLIFAIFFTITFAKFIFGKKLINNKSRIILLITAICIALIFITIFFKEFLIKAINMLVQKPHGFFPNALFFVAELQSAKNISDFLSYFGGFFVICFFLGIFSFFAQPPKNKNQTMFLFIWLIIFILPAFSAARILFFLLAPFAIISGRGLKLAADTISDTIYELLPKQANVIQQAIKIIIFFFMILIIFLVSNPFTLQMPQQLVTNSINNAARFIEANSLPNAVILTWWDLGYAWQALSNRATVFDGGLFNTPRLYWVSKILNSQDETLAANSARLMACNADAVITQFEEGTRAYSSDLHTFDAILGSIQEKNANRRANKLCVPLTKILCDKNFEIFFVVTQDMIYQIPFFEHYGEWNFGDSIIRETTKGMPQEDAITNLKSKYDISSAAAKKKYERAISFGNVAQKSIGKIGKCSTSKNQISCDNGISLDLTSFSATAQGRRPKSVVFINNLSKKIRYYDNFEIEYSLVIYGDSNKGYSSILIEQSLIKKIVMRMFFGEKIANFERVFVSEAPSRVVVYKLNISAKKNNAANIRELLNSEVQLFIKPQYRSKQILILNYPHIALNIPSAATYAIITPTKNDTQKIGVPHTFEYYDVHKVRLQTENIETELRTEFLLNKIKQDAFCEL